ncbi:MAG TPA: 30S ribosomal protein S11, partial [Candidatus Paceibacterota bacterium]|nr:30S ribosomal protein S11 [Candidatus Paceibacterota bacterium]
MAEETKKKAAPKKEAKPAEAPAAEETKAPKKAPVAEGKVPKTPEAPAAAEAKAPELPVAAAAPTAAELLADDLAGKKIVKAKGAKNISVGIANILATFNNTQVTITD